MNKFLALLKLNITDECLPREESGPENLPGEVIRHARRVSELAMLSYDNFSLYMDQLNDISRKYMDRNGKHLVFSIKRGTDSTMFWKSTVRISCDKMDPDTNQVETYNKAFNNKMEEARTLLLNGDIKGTQEKLVEAMHLKPTPALRQFVAIQELVARLPLETMNEFYSENKKFFSLFKSS